jgi:DNA polymerase-3 subunit gamma/tau
VEARRADPRDGTAAGAGPEGRATGGTSVERRARARAGSPAAADAAATAAPPPYLALARKYRPLRFEEVVGQEAVGRTLRGALRTGRIPSAFLFAGPRGTGKTTMARILARALNCAAAPGPTPDPCGTCGTCVAVADGSSLDVVEVDAASHNGVDDVREIRERVAHLPASSRFKVYILDEAHMFSNAAWNAFLKTLEEPPAHARFLFATTEPEKVPETILSRCQRFDFRRIQAPDIVRTLKEILRKEGEERGATLRVSDAALAALARAARGGLRDAESLLEQALLAGDGEVREEDLVALVGAVPRERVRAVLDAAAAGDGAGALAAYAAIHEGGGDAGVFLAQALEMLREAAAVAVAGANTSLLDLEDSEREAVAALAGRLGAGGALRATQALAETLRLVKATDEERCLVEAGILRVALGAGTRTLGEAIDSLAAMEARLGGADPGPGPAAGGAGAPPRGDAPRGPAPPGPAPRPGSPAPTGGSPAPPGGSPAAGPAGGATPPSGSARGLFGAAAEPEVEPLELAAVAEAWPRVLEDLLARNRRSVRAFVEPARPSLVGPGWVQVAWPASAAFHRRSVEAPEMRAAVEESLSAVLGRRLALRFETVPDAAPAAAPEREPAADPSDRLRRSDVDRLRETPAVKALEATFQVTMVKAGRRAPREGGAAGPEPEEAT